MTKKFYITTAIPYVNAAPHIGFALEIVQADVIARYHRLINDDVYFLTGTDENSLKNVQAAEKQNLPVRTFVDLNAQKFEDLKEGLNLSFDDFIRTTETRHLVGSQKLWEKCQKDIYKKRYRGLYCLGCETFYLEKDLVDGKCPEHKTIPETFEEENYFFRLSSYQSWLDDLISDNKLKIVPETRKNEVLSFIRRGLDDFSISRSRKRAHGWGVPVPNDADQIIYVWFDALANYITALDWQDSGQLFQKFWPADVHVIGKGIIRFHAIYWPAILKSAGLPIPKEIFAHGYLTIAGQKISKSLGNTVDPFELVKNYGIDPIRYYFLKEIPAYGDGDFSLTRFKEVYNADLANGLGNLTSRVAKLCQLKNFVNKTRKPQLINFLIKQVNYCNYLEKFEFNLALAEIWRSVKNLNLLIDSKKIWELKNQEAQLTLSELVTGIREIAFSLIPFLPETAEKIEKQFSQEKITPQPPLFARIK